MRVITLLRHQLVFDKGEFLVEDPGLNATVEVREITVLVDPSTNRPMVSYSGFYKPDLNADEKHYVSSPADIVTEQGKIPRLVHQICSKLDGVRVSDYDLPLWLEGKV